MVAEIVKDDAGMQDIVALLRKNNLPFQDLSLDGNLFIKYYNGDKVVGAGGLEFYSGLSLLRSVAVEETERGKAIGKFIVSDLITNAREKSIEEIYLLTETARTFFLNLGFADVSRENIPEQIKATSEFLTVCPVSAVCMVYKI